VPREAYHSADDRSALSRFPKLVYQDRQVGIAENAAALPRAWIVHAAEKLDPSEALTAIASGVIDPRTTAALEAPPPPLASPPNAASDRATLIDYGADRFTVDTSSATPGLLMLSEVYYPAWRAYVDGQPAPTYVADGALRAIPVPAGSHRVEQRFES